MSATELAILALATWRLSRLLVDERGPWGLLVVLRERLADVEHDERGRPVSWPDGERGLVIRCLDCCSVWLGLGLVGLYLWAPAVAIVLALPFALSAAAILAGRLNGDG